MMWKSPTIIERTTTWYPFTLERRCVWRWTQEGCRPTDWPWPCGVPSGRITDILGGKRAITPETALRLGRYFGTGAEIWLNLQTAYDLAVAERDLGERIAADVQPAA